jgi:hypothetical protein
MINRLTLSTSGAPSPTSENASLMADWASDTNIFITEELSDYSDSDSLNDEESYKVERILGHKVSYPAGVEEYLYYVRWAGYGLDDDGWISLGSFDGLTIIEKYH